MLAQHQIHEYLKDSNGTCHQCQFKKFKTQQASKTVSNLNMKRLFMRRCLHIYTQQKIQILYKLTFHKSNIFVITSCSCLIKKNHICAWNFLGRTAQWQARFSKSLCNEMVGKLPGPACLVPVAAGSPLPEFVYGWYQHTQSCLGLDLYHPTAAYQIPGAWCELH